MIWAADLGIVQGYGGGIFGPDDPVSREQLAAILWRQAGEPSGDVADLDGFADEARISGWARPALSWAVAAGVLRGRDGGVLDPGSAATRAETAQVLMNLLQ